MQADNNQTLNRQSDRLLRIVSSAIRIWGRAVEYTKEDLCRVDDYLLNSVPPGDHGDLQRPRQDYFPGLSNKPWHDAASFEWSATLKQAAAVIREEFLALDSTLAYAPHPGTLTSAGQWNTYYFRSLGRKFADHDRSCPKTAKIIDSIPQLSSGGAVYFSILEPKSRIKPHCGPTNTRLRCHLGLLVPEGDCGIRVGSETRTWKEGECFVFDDSFEHEVWNDTDQPRVVLIVDVWHPDLSDAEIWAVKKILRLAHLKRKASGHLRDHFQAQRFVFRRAQKE